MIIILAYAWTDEEGADHIPDERVEVEPHVGQTLIHDGKARVAPPPDEAEEPEPPARPVPEPQPYPGPMPPRSRGTEGD